ncbi:hypothetical protein WQQ_06310 [Hydrocarboniphaga effusa AP103]|uniref:Uncharacterized protein n=1 Tax=Hydrocarboniphaga effusa AP103 TaxID=1172194 RepID=I7ZF39_9GAMM|nr:hypothetical protein WQQ_06310 [Hydrocarboniphaga effusa AP103]
MVADEKLRPRAISTARLDTTGSRFEKTFPGGQALRPNRQPFTLAS